MNPAPSGGQASPGPLPDPVRNAIQRQDKVLSDHARLLQEASAMMQSISGEQQTQSQQLHQVAKEQQALLKHMQDLSSQLAALVTTAQPVQVTSASVSPATPGPVAQPVREPKLTSPKPYDGAFSDFRGFMLQCNFVFDLQPSMFSTDAARVAYIATHTSGDALRWVQSFLCSNPGSRNNFATFEEEFRRVFDHPFAGQDAGSRLLHIKQGSRSVAAYAIEFRTLAASTGWADSTLRCIFQDGLTEALRDELVRDKPTDLNMLVSLAIDVDERLRERKKSRAQSLQHSSRLTPILSSSPPRSSETLAPDSVADVEPMEVGRLRLSAAEREHRRSRGLCMYCGQAGHQREDCPKLPCAPSRPTEEDSIRLGRIRVTPRGRLSQAERERRRLHGLCRYCASSTHTVRSCPILCPKMSSSRAPGGEVSPARSFRVRSLITSQPRASVARFPVTLSWEGQSHEILALIDSGADESFVDLQYAQRVGLPVSALQRPLSAFALNGHNLGPISHRTQPLTVSGDHVESIRPYIIHSPDAPFILGRPWLELHTPHVCWSSGRILSWSAACQVCCLQPAPTSAQAEHSPVRVPPRPKGRRRRRALPDVPRKSPGDDPWEGGPVTVEPPHPTGVCPPSSGPREGATSPLRGATAHTRPLKMGVSLHTCSQSPVITRGPEATRVWPAHSSAPDLPIEIPGKY